MATDFKFPDVGEGIQEGEVVKWLVKEGDKVKADQVIVKVETDKAVVDLPAPVAGTILKINYKEGQKVNVGAVLVVIGESGEKVKVSKEESKESKQPKKEEKPAKAEKAGKKEEGRKTGSVVGQLEEAPDEEIVQRPQTIALQSPPLAAGSTIRAAPAARLLAAQRGVNLAQVTASGANGEITRQDVENYAGKLSSIPQQTIPVKKTFGSQGYEERIPLKGIRKSIATNMVTSLRESAQVTFMEDINVTTLWSIREREKHVLEEQKVKLTFLPFFIKAVIAALRENPLFNASLEGEDIIVKKYYNIGVAVETEAGLMVPVIGKADEKSMIDIARELEVLAEKARTRSIGINDMQNGTFTITNYGSVGGTYATPILNVGEAGILGTGKIFEKVIPNKSSMGFSVARILPVSFTFDHRIADGAQAARFIESLKIFLEDPEHLLMDLH